MFESNNGGNFVATYVNIALSPNCRDPFGIMSCSVEACCDAEGKRHDKEKNKVQEVHDCTDLVTKHARCLLKQCFDI